MKGLKRKLGMEGCFASHLIGRRGGLALFYKDTEALEIQSFSHWHASAIVRKDDKKGFLFIGFYRHPNT